MPPSSPLSDLSRAELEALLVELFGEVAALKQTISEQREEIARLKGLKGRPMIKPSGMDDATEPLKPANKGKRRFRGKVTPRVKVEDQVVKVAVPEGSRFKGHEPFLVQDLVISAKATCYQRERWVTPDGRTILAPLPEGIEGHFGPELRRFVLMQYHQGQSTLPRLAALLRSLGVSISKRQLQRLLNVRMTPPLAVARVPADVAISGASAEKAVVAASLNEATMTLSTRPYSRRSPASVASYGLTSGAVCLMSRLSSTSGHPSSTALRVAMPSDGSSGARPRYT